MSSEIASFEEIFKNTKLYEESPFFNQSHEIYQYLYDLLYKMDLQKLNVCLFNETEGFFATAIKQLAKSLVLFPSNEETNKSKNKSKSHQTDNFQEKLMPPIDCAFIANYKKDAPIIKKNFNIDETSNAIENLASKINKYVLYQGAIIFFNIEGDELVSKIARKTDFTSIQKFPIKPMEKSTSSTPDQLSFEISILTVKKVLSSQFSIKDEHFTKDKILYEKMSKVSGGKNKKRNFIICQNGFLCIYDESAKYADVNLSQARGFIFLPLFKKPEKISKNKPTEVVQKKSLLNNLTHDEYENLHEADKTNGRFDFKWRYEISYSQIELDNLNKSFFQKIASRSSFTDLNFDARLYTLPGYKTLEEPLDIPVNIKLNSDGIFIYSSFPFYHIVFADFWDINSYATPFPYTKLETKFKGYRQTVAIVITKNSRQAVNDDDDNSADISRQIEIEEELDFLFNCEKPVQKEEVNDSNDNDSDLTSGNKEKEESKSKNDKNKNKNKGKNEQSNEKAEKPSKIDKNEDQNIKNEKPKNDDQENDYKPFQLPKQKKKQSRILKIPLGCISLKFENPILMMNFVIAVSESISCSISSQIQKSMEKMITKLNNEKQTDEQKNKVKTEIPTTLDYQLK